MTGYRTHKGFTLIELAVVLVVIGLLLGGLLRPLAAQVEARKQNETRGLLAAAREALYGFAMLNGRLPCPDTSGDGRENPGCGTALTVRSGSLPWATLGLPQGQDAWYQALGYAVNGAFTSQTTLAATLPDPATWAGWAGVLAVYDGDTGNCTAGTVQAANVPAVVVSTGKPKVAGQTGPDERENTDNDACFVSRTPGDVAGDEYNDQLVWLSPHVLFQRLVAAGQLP